MGGRPVLRLFQGQWLKEDVVLSLSLTWVCLCSDSQGGEQDYLVVLAVADTLWPGTYLKLAGDPDILESKFVELFVS